MNIGLGAGTEQNRIASRNPAENTFTSGVTKPSFSLRLGGTLSPNFRLGAEVTGWSESFYNADLQGTETDYLVGTMLVGQFYPSRRAGFFVKGGGGLSWSGASIPGPGDANEGGFAWTAGLGYEVKLGHSLFITPTVDIMEHRSTTRDNVTGSLLPTFIQRVASVGIALTIQPGR